MRNRWYHRPVFHDPHKFGEKKATWLELFYDLIFVAAFIHLGNGFSDHVGWEGALRFVMVFVPMWVVWTGYTFFINRFTIDDFIHRIIVFVQMFSIGAMAVGAPEVLEKRHTVFVTSFAVAQGVIAFLYIRSWLQVKDGRAYSGYWGAVFAAGAMVWVASLLLPEPAATILRGVALLGVISAPLSRQSRAIADRFPGDQEHLSERYGLLTIIVLGESFVKVLSSLYGKGASLPVLGQAGVLLVLTCCLWWIYFDDVAGSRIRGRRFTPIIWLYAHLPLQMALTATGVAIKKAVAFDMMVPAPEAYRWLFSGSLGLALLSVAVIDSVTERRQAELSDTYRVAMRFFSAALLLLLAPGGGGMPAYMFVILVTSVLIAQVVFDMMMAPFESTEIHHLPDIQEEPDETVPLMTETVRRIGISETVRKGTPSALRRDLYFYFMEGGWIRFLASLMFVFLMTNVLFAGLFMLQPGCIDGSNPQTFADAFFFSVQTISTIGFGVLSPATLYANIVVTVEAAAGLLGVAVATGLTFAKVSQPRAAILFSRNLLVMTYEDRPTLLFRAGNARGNDIADATVSVTAVIQETSAEGYELRRMYDLPLVRERSPLFALTWTVMHPLDETSPLRALADGEIPDKLDVLIVTIHGHDATYGQTVYARHLYGSHDILHGRRFVDIDEELEDGRLMLDFSRFHHTEPV